MKHIQALIQEFKKCEIKDLITDFSYTPDSLKFNMPRNKELTFAKQFKLKIYMRTIYKLEVSFDYDLEPTNIQNIKIHLKRL